MKRIDEIIRKYEERAKQGYEYTPLGEVLSDLQYIKPKKINPTPKKEATQK